MNYVEEKGNLFNTKDIEKYVVLHCISRDAKMGAGFAKYICDMYVGLREFVKSEIDRTDCQVPSYMLVHVKTKDNKKIRIINLITKERYFNKPCLNDIKDSLRKVAKLCIDKNIKFLLMPRIGSGLDAHQWCTIKKIIHDVFHDIDINILVKYI